MSKKEAKVTPESIVIDGVTFVPEGQDKSYDGETKIFVIDRGWVMVGCPDYDGEYVSLSNAYVIRVWGTVKGIGELRDGPTDKTELDYMGNVEVRPDKILFDFVCAPIEGWNKRS